jgi:hypothetical protein
MMNNKNKIKKIIFSLAFIGVFCLANAASSEEDVIFSENASTLSVPVSSGVTQTVIKADDGKWYTENDDGTVTEANLSEMSETATKTKAAETTTEAAKITTTTTSSSTYQNQEKIPGSAQTTNFVTYLKSIINFGFAVIGILALFMLLIGAYQYLMAAGTDNASSAKETISSALLGLLLGLCAWVILNKINPDLVGMKEPTASSATSSSAASTAAGTSASGSKGSGNCTTNQGSCLISNLSCFGSNAESASKICGYESGGGSAFAKSTTDKCTTGESFSIGLFQINLTVHDIGNNCTSAFSGTNSSCKVINDTKYKECVTLAQDATTNIKYACQIYKDAGSSFTPWKNTSTTCGI